MLAFFERAMRPFQAQSGGGIDGHRRERLRRGKLQAVDGEGEGQLRVGRRRRAGIEVRAHGDRNATRRSSSAGRREMRLVEVERADRQQRRDDGLAVVSGRGERRNAVFGDAAQVVGRQRADLRGELARRRSALSWSA